MMHLLMPHIHMGFRQNVGWKMEKSQTFVFQDILWFLWLFQQVTEAMISIKIHVTLPCLPLFFSCCICLSGLYFIPLYIPSIEVMRVWLTNTSFISLKVLFFLEHRPLSAVHSQYCINQDRYHRALEWYCH